MPGTGARDDATGAGRAVPSAADCVVAYHSSAVGADWDLVHAVESVGRAGLVVVSGAVIVLALALGARTIGSSDRASLPATTTTTQTDADALAMIELVGGEVPEALAASVLGDGVVQVGRFTLACPTPVMVHGGAHAEHRTLDDHAAGLLATHHDAQVRRQSHGATTLLALRVGSDVVEVATFERDAPARHRWTHSIRCP